MDQYAAITLKNYGMPRFEVEKSRWLMYHK